jgi:hypothetical protein
VHFGWTVFCDYICPRLEFFAIILGKGLTCKHHLKNAGRISISSFFVCLTLLLSSMQSDVQWQEDHQKP